MKRYTDTILSATTGLPLLNATVTVRLAGTTTLATLYAQNNTAGPTLANPFPVNGRFEFYTPNGRYDITVAAGGQTPTLADLEIYDIGAIAGIAASNQAPFSPATLAAAAAMTIPTGITSIQVGGATVLGDSGAGMRLVAETAVTPAYVVANPQTSFRDSAGRGFRAVAGDRFKTPYGTPYLRLISDKQLDRITVKDFGADNQPVGVGNAAWDTAGFKRAIDFMANYRTQTILSDGGAVYTGPALSVPAGQYILNSSITADFPAAERILFRGSGVNATVIKVAAGAHFVETSNRLESTYIGHMSFIGGKGVFRHTFTGNNVSQSHIIEDCFCIDYTGTAISSDSADMPYWLIQRCFFAGGNGPAGTVRGIALGGLLDCLDIQQNRFVSNDYHCVIGPVSSGSWRFTNNDCISLFSDDRTLADLWIRPNDGRPTPAGTLFRSEAGNGSSIIGNKFGNERVTSFEKKAPRILIAAAQEPGGNVPARNTAIPDPAWKNGTDGKHYLGGIIIDQNRFSTASTKDSANVVHDGPGGSLVAIYANNIDRINWGGANSFDGGSYEYIVQHIDGGARLPSAQNMNWNVTIPPSGAPTRKGFTNSPVGHIVDLSGGDGGPYSIMPGTSPDATDQLLGVVDAPAAWATNGGVTKISATNVDGANDATLFTFNGTAASISYNLPGPMTGKTGRAGFIRGRYKLSGTTPRRFMFYMNASNRDIQAKTVVLQPAGDWKTILLSCPWPADVVYALFTIAAIDQANGDQLTLGDFKFIAGKAPPVL